MSDRVIDITNSDDLRVEADLALNMGQLVADEGASHVAAAIAHSARAIVYELRAAMAEMRRWSS